MKTTLPLVSLSELRGYSQLATDAVLAMTDRVEHMHQAIASLSPPLGRREPRPTRGITRLVYQSVRGVTRLVATGSDLCTRRFVANPTDGSHVNAASLAVMNGIIGDHLHASNNPLAIPMRLYHNDRVLPLDCPEALEQTLQPKPRVLIMLHGLCMNHRQWQRGGHNHGEALAQATGRTALYLHYNSGLPIAENGRRLAEVLDQLSECLPDGIEDIAVLGYSMGGLVARSACHYGLLADHRWPERLSRLMFLATPHHGSALERGGHWLEHLLGISPYTTPISHIGRLRSAGITDLRHGQILHATSTHSRFESNRPDSDDRALFPAHTRCYAIAATRSRKPVGNGKALKNDGLVSTDSALAAKAELPITTEQQHIVYDTGHLKLLDSHEALQTLITWNQ